MCPFPLFLMIIEIHVWPISSILTVTFIGETGFEIILWARLDYIIIQIVHLYTKKTHYRLHAMATSRTPSKYIIVVMQTTVL